MLNGQPPVTPAAFRRDQLTRHGLIVADENPDRITLMIDVPNADNPSDAINTQAQFTEELYTRLVAWALHEVENRLLTQRFSNASGPPPANHGRIAITIVTDKETPYGVYLAVEQALQNLCRRLNEARETGVVCIREEKTSYGDMTIEWITGGHSSDLWWEGIEVIPRWKPEFLAHLPK
ncbi:hypothetical protein BDW59DRAFT_162131 [Aspergillus cavernicola]|uniref:Uncharacterized protein n=1 Tax=Aspergillus cavernicola TaxID=176166 RepID=A0ABR4IB31_9EURO